MSFVKRIVIYYRAMFPPITMLVVASLFFLSFFYLLLVVDGGGKAFYPETWFGILTIFLILMLFRMHDELKDQEVDKIHHPTRPLVTGAVKYNDIRKLIIIAYFVVVGINVGRGNVTSMFLIVLLFLVLSTQWFFFPDEVRNNYFLLSITHQPLAPLVFGYVYAVYLYVTGNAIHPWPIVPFCLMYTLPIMIWEITRKTKAPSQETKFLSYTLMWGIKKAAIVPMIYISVLSISLTVIAVAYNFSWYFIVGNNVLVCILFVLFIRFIQRPVAERNILKPAFFGYWGLCQLGIILEVVLRKVL